MFESLHFIQTFIIFPNLYHITVPHLTLTKAKKQVLGQIKQLHYKYKYCDHYWCNYPKI